MLSFVRILKFQSKNKISLRFSVKNAEDNTELDMEIKLKEFENTVKKLDIDGLKGKTIEKLFNAHIRNLKDLFNLDSDTVKALNLSGFGDKSVKSLITGINAKKSKLNCVQLMEASNAFGNGFASKTLQLIYDKYPDFMKSKPTVEQLTAIEGIGDVMAEKFVKNIDAFTKYLQDNELASYCDVKKNAVAAAAEKQKKGETKTGKFSNMKFLFTGGKDKELIAFIQGNGGIVEGSWSKSIDVLITAKPDTQSTKYKKAIANNTTVLSVEEFKTKYM